MKSLEVPRLVLGDVHASSFDRLSKCYIVADDVAVLYLQEYPRSCRIVVVVYRNWR
jgi:hypothetical protein